MIEASYKILAQVLAKEPSNFYEYSKNNFRYLLGAECLCVCIYVNIYIYKYMYVYMCMFIYMYIFMCIYMYIN